MTLNQIVNRLETLCKGHAQIHTFYFGDALEWFAGEDLKYPACLVDLSRSKIDRGEKQHLFSFEILIADLVNVSADSRANIVEVYSDLVSIMEDLVALINDPVFYDDWNIDSSYDLEYLEDKFDDVTAAIKMNITISTDYLTDRCQVPTA